MYMLVSMDHFCGYLWYLQVVDNGAGAFTYNETGPPEPITGLELTDEDSVNR